MSDTSLEVKRIIAERYRQTTPEERMRMAASMFETVRVIAASNSHRRERRLAFALRMYGDELPKLRCRRSLTGDRT